MLQVLGKLIDPTIDELAMLQQNGIEAGVPTGFIDLDKLTNRSLRLVGSSPLTRGGPSRWWS